jgi:novobiocin biosynthesis protein NovU/D-mycarose 3-C-methyltransferase
MKVTRCRLCTAESLEPVLDYGRVALADGFLDPGSDLSTEPSFPLVLCLCRACEHLQIDEVVDPVVLFRNYIYVTGVSESVLRHAGQLYDTLTEVVPPPRNRPLRVVEAASNDGTVLAVFRDRGAKVLGVDPAENVVKIARDRGIPTLAEFFNAATARWVAQELPEADLFIARNVLAHVADLHGFCEGIRQVLGPGGVGVIEVPHALTMFRELQYDQVFHEHLGYFTLTCLEYLLQRFDLTVFSVRQIPLHGGSLQVYLSHRGAGRPVEESVGRIKREEAQLGVGTLSAWGEFAARVTGQRDALRSELASLQSAGKRIAAYGASAKGQAMLQFCGIDRTLVDFVVDKSELKQGKLTPGTHIPVYGTERLLEAPRPDVVLLSAWNFADEILRQQRPYLEGGGRMLHPLPMPHYVS